MREAARIATNIAKVIENEEYAAVMNALVYVITLQLSQAVCPACRERIAGWLKEKITVAAADAGQVAREYHGSATCEAHARLAKR